MTKLHVLALLSTALPACAGTGAITIDQTALTGLKYNEAFPLRSGIVVETAASPSAPRATSTMTGSEVAGSDARDTGSGRAHAMGMARHETHHPH